MRQIEKSTHFNYFVFSAFKFLLLLTLILSTISKGKVSAQTAYFVDGFHGGIWGHYPKGYTSYIVAQLNKHPDWKINLEIEPETWDRVERLDNKAYSDLKAFLTDKSRNGRIEYVNPAYGQSYMYNISGESIISQFNYGIKKLRQHFPSLEFSTYSSEEPCFTSALPQILKSFGFKYASLKNPNTCWGGYTSAFGNGLVNWIGPDGTKILAVPRYEFETLKPNSTWETIGNANSPAYIDDAFKNGVQSPVGMCLQDAGWQLGPWLKNNFYQPSQYTTWKNYFENINPNHANATDWRFSQEDVKVGLVWGAQVLQRIAQEVRIAENKIVQAEKIAAFRSIDNKSNYPSNTLEKAWQPLLLAQHHDCWIVPYNGKKGDTWADKVKGWTAFTDSKSDSIMLVENKPSTTIPALKVYNTTLYDRQEWIDVKLPKGWDAAKTVVLDKDGIELPTQPATDKTSDALLFKGFVPSAGYSFFHLKKKKPSIIAGANIKKLENGDFQLETDLYRLIIDPKHGGVIKELIAKQLKNKNFVDTASAFGFNQLRGNFFNKGGFHSSADSPAKVRIVKNGPAQISLAIDGQIAGEPYTQTISLNQGQKRIDLSVKIDWKSIEGIGEFAETDYQAAKRKKAFYNDRYKLLTLFPLSLKGQKVFKNAPFDVMESKLENTFFSSWDSIKNNVILNWVDVVDENNAFGCAMYTDHTTSYTHGQDFPLGLNIQYVGKGLWGRNYNTEGATEISYALIPHFGDWKKAELWKESELINEPLQTALVPENIKNKQKSFFKTTAKGWVLSSCTIDGNDLLLRIFNAEGTAQKSRIDFAFKPTAAISEQLNGTLIEKLLIEKTKNGSFTTLSIPPMGFKTIRLKHVK
ncbi:alpha-mannosidase [Pedobacter sp. UYP30]|uniref:glycoside hydrolase family 38 N-terminal domain-containing protein n=1 Tax=Pedobacter sp. UYP30 TaxID=1756400 RepID=UPI0033995018